LSWDEAADRRDVVQEFDDDARVVQRGAVVQQQRGHFAERVVRNDRGILGRHIDQLELALDALLGEHHAHLATVGTGERDEQLHA